MSVNLPNMNGVGKEIITCVIFFPQNISQPILMGKLSQNDWYNIQQVWIGNPKLSGQCQCQCW